jgi:predicted transcriptional regulator of viral defense system
MKSPEEIIQSIFANNHGYLQAKHLQRSSALYDYLRKLVASGEVVKLKAGLYKNEAMASANEFQELSKIYPHGVICLQSAWSYYELTTQIPAFHTMAFPNKTKITFNEYPPIQAHYWSQKFYELEIVYHDGIRIYSLEKSICDAIKFRNKIGIHEMRAILKNYLRRKDKDLNALFETAKILNLDKKLREYLNLV